MIFIFESVNKKSRNTDVSRLLYDKKINYYLISFAYLVNSRSLAAFAANAASF